MVGSTRPARSWWSTRPTAGTTSSGVHDGIGLPTQECIQSLSTATCLDLGPTGTEACHLKPVAFP